MFEEFEKRLPGSDYLVGWVDCLSEGAGLGRGEIHQANYLHEDEDPAGEAGFHTERQTLPTRILGFPKDKLWYFMRPFFNNPGVRLINTAKMVSARMNHGDTKKESSIAVMVAAMTRNGTYRRTLSQRSHAASCRSG